MPPSPIPDQKPSELTEPTALKSVVAGEAAPDKGSWQRIAPRSRAYGRVAALLGAILIVGVAGGYMISIGLHNPTPTAKTSNAKIETLSPADISKLSQVGTNLGTSNQVLTIAANSVFQGKVNIASDLTLGGTFNANGPVSLSSLSIAGQTTLTNLIVQQALQVNGLLNAQKGLSVQGLAGVNGNLNVSGTATIATISANTIAVKSLQISGPLSVVHFITSGPPVTSSSGASIGAGGTSSASGNDAAGAIQIGLGSNASAGTLITVNFRSSYGSNVHVLLSPTSSDAAQTPVYVIRSPNGFSVVTPSATPRGTLSYDYFVTQ